MRRFRPWSSVVLALLIAAPFPANGEPPHHPDWEYVRTVLLFSEFGRRDGYITRWTRSARVTVAAEDEKHLKMVRKAIRQLNIALRQTKMSLSLVWNRPDIYIQFVPRAKMQEAGAEYNCGIMTPDTYAFGCMYHDAQGIMKLGIIVHPTDDDGIDLATSVMEELTQVLGPANDTHDPLFVESLFYEPERLQPLMYKDLSPHDRKLLQFLYNHLQPGDTEKEVRAAFDKHWDAIRVPGSD